MPSASVRDESNRRGETIISLKSLRNGSPAEAEEKSLHASAFGSLLGTAHTGTTKADKEHF